jgi:hypothetical protein
MVAAYTLNKQSRTTAKNQPSILAGWFGANNYSQQIDKTFIKAKGTILLTKI